MNKYYCPFCKKHFEGWSVGHSGWNSVCRGGCNTSKDKMIAIQLEMEQMIQSNHIHDESLRGRCSVCELS